MQSSKYLVFGLFSNLEININSNIKVLRYCHLNLNLILLLEYSGVDVDQCRPTIGMRGEFKATRCNKYLLQMN